MNPRAHRRLSLEVVGISDETATFMTSMVFVTHGASDAILRAPGTTSYVLAGTTRPVEVRERLEARGLAVIESAELGENDVKLWTKVFGVPLRLMVGVAFAAGTLIITLTAYTSVIERRREYGIIKAIGADDRRLTSIVVRQTLALAALGMAAGGLLFFAGRALITWARPQFSVVLTAGSLARTLAAAIVMGLAAALIPARRVAAMDPASVYRGG